jgi:hypothetical protein
MPWSDIIGKAIKFGRQKGFVTFGELNGLLAFDDGRTGRHRSFAVGVK